MRHIRKQVQDIIEMEVFFAMNDKGLRKISIIVPVFCVERYLRKCLDSIMNQTYNNLEIILVDDGSTDSCPQICDEYKKKDSRFLVVHKENGGVSSARNTGLKIATGDYIGFVDSDDYIDEQMYESLLNICETYNVDLASVRYDEVSEKIISQKCTGETIVFDRNEYLRNIAFLNNKYFITQSVWTNLYKRELVNGIFFPEDRNIAEDFAYNRLAISRTKNCGYYDKVLYHYRTRNNSIIHEIDYKSLLLSLLPYFEEDLAFYSENKVLLYFKCSYYNLIIPLIAETLSKEKEKRVNEFLHKTRLPFIDIIAIKMPFKTKINSIKKHLFPRIYIILKKAKKSISSKF